MKVYRSLPVRSAIAAIAVISLCSFSVSKLSAQGKPLRDPVPKVDPIIEFNAPDAHELEVRIDREAVIDRKAATDREALVDRDAAADQAAGDGRPATSRSNLAIVEIATPFEIAPRQESESAAKTADDEGEPLRIELTDDPAEPKLLDTPAPLTQEMIKLRDSIEVVLDHYRDRPEDVSRRSPWGIMHAMIAFEVDSQIIVQGERVNALGWLCWNRPCAGQQLMYVQRGQLATRNGPGVQGHDGQFLAMLAQCGVRSDNELRVNNKSFTVQDLIELEQRTCRAGTELTFKLIGLSYYLDSDDVWTGQDGSKWNIARLIQEELKQPVVGAACGGTHRIMGFAFAVKQRKWEGKPIEGQWLRAQTYVDDFIEYTFQLQNPDGSFSTQWFERRDARTDAARRIQTTGHMLEWLVFAVEDDELDDPRIIKATDYLTRLLWQNRNRRLEIGPKGHALHALHLYKKRRFGSNSELAEGEFAIDR